MNVQSAKGVIASLSEQIADLKGSPAESVWELILFPGELSKVNDFLEELAAENERLLEENNRLRNESNLYDEQKRELVEAMFNKCTLEQLNAVAAQIL